MSSPADATTVATGTPAGGTLAKRFGPRDSTWWWIWIAATCGVLGAHVVAQGYSFASILLVILTILMTAPLSGWITHQRAWALMLGAYAAFCFFVALELYLGVTGLYYGPIGNNGRPLREFDTLIIDGLLLLYRNS